MARHRRHPRDRRATHPERPSRPPHGERRVAAKDAERRHTEFQAGQARIAKRRNVVALLALPILLLTLPCGSVPIPLPCDLPREALFLVFSAIFGGYLGMTIRMFLDRRRYAREVRPSTS